MAAGYRQGAVCNLCSIGMNTNSMMTHPYRWAVSVYLLGWIGLSAKWCSEVDPAASSTAALAYFFIPMRALVYATPFILIGLLLAFIHWAIKSRKRRADYTKTPEGERDD